MPEPEPSIGGSVSGAIARHPVYAGGRIYFTSEECETTVVEAGKQFKLVARNQLDGQCLASMAISDRAVFVRGNSDLYRLGLE